MTKKRDRDWMSFYIWQTAAYGETFYYDDKPADVFKFRPMPSTPAGDYIASCSSPALADPLLDEIDSMDVRQARAYLLSKPGFYLEPNMRLE